MTKVLWFGVVTLAVVCVIATFTEESNAVAVVALAGEFIMLGFIVIVQKLDDIIKKLTHD